MEAPKPEGVVRRLFEGSFEKSVFYLDLPASKITEDLKKVLTDFGGRIDGFFSKDVTCVITNRVENGEQTQRKSSRIQKQNQQTVKSQHMTRAQSILANSKQKSGRNTKDFISMAKDLGIAVRFLDEFKGLLEGLKGKEGNENGRVLRKNVRQKGMKAEKRKLKAPFLKVEDKSCLYQPLIKEMNEWPKIYLESQQPNCPFDPPFTSSRGQMRSKGQTGSKNRSSSSGPARSKTDRAKVMKQDSSKGKIGFCELCNTNYRSIKQHLNGLKHCNNASNCESYKQLDDVVSQGRTFNEYLENLKAKGQSSQRRDKVESANLPSSLRTPTKSESIANNVCTPLKIILSPIHGLSVVKVENQRKRKLDYAENKEDEIAVSRAQKKAKINDVYTVVQLSDLKLKIRRSTRLLRGTDLNQHGSMFVEFPTYKDGLKSLENEEDNSSNCQEPVVLPKYGKLHGQIRVSARIMDAEEQNGLEVFKCPMYMETNEN